MVQLKVFTGRTQYYPDNQVTDHPERFIIAELIREKVLHLTREEVPHSVAVVIDAIQNVRAGQFILMQRLLWNVRRKRDYYRKTREDVKRSR